MEITCVRVGSGTIAWIHEEALRGLGVRTLAVLEPDERLHERIRAEGFVVAGSYEAAAALRPVFWDVCTPTECHAEVLGEISRQDPAADVVVEKPVCDHDDLALFGGVLAAHRGRVVVNENYASSAVNEAVAARVGELGLRPTKVIVEMTKHRGADFLGGRFLDPALGAFGYEGSHLIAAVAALGEQYLSGTVVDLDVDDLVLTTSRPSPLDNSLWDTCPEEGRAELPHQGGAFVAYDTADGCRVELYTSMSGIVGYPCPPYAPPAPVIGPDDPVTRYRLFRVDGTDPDGVAYQVVGFYEPLPGLARGQGALAVFREWALSGPVTLIDDDTMTRHFTRVLAHFRGAGPNPCPADHALAAVHRLQEWAKAGKAAELNSNDVLGSADSAADRAADRARFLTATR